MIKIKLKMSSCTNLQTYLWCDVISFISLRTGTVESASSNVQPQILEQATKVFNNLELIENKFYSVKSHLRDEEVIRN